MSLFSAPLSLILLSIQLWNTGRTQTVILQEFNLNDSSSNCSVVRGGQYLFFRGSVSTTEENTKDMVVNVQLSTRDNRNLDLFILNVTEDGCDPTPKPNTAYCHSMEDFTYRIRINFTAHQSMSSRRIRLQLWGEYSSEFRDFPTIQSNVESTLQVDDQEYRLLDSVSRIHISQDRRTASTYLFCVKNIRQPSSVTLDLADRFVVTVRDKECVEATRTPQCGDYKRPYRFTYKENSACGLEKTYHLGVVTFLFYQGLSYDVENPLCSIIWKYKNKIDITFCLFNLAVPYLLEATMNGTSLGTTSLSCILVQGINQIGTIVFKVKGNCSDSPQYQCDISYQATGQSVVSAELIVNDKSHDLQNADCYFVWSCQTPNLWVDLCAYPHGSVSSLAVRIDNIPLNATGGRSGPCFQIDRLAHKGRLFIKIWDKKGRASEYQCSVISNDCPQAPICEGFLGPIEASLTFNGSVYNFTRETCVLSMAEDENVSLTFCIHNSHELFNFRIVVDNSGLPVQMTARDCVKVNLTVTLATFTPNFIFEISDKCWAINKFNCSVLLLIKEREMKMPEAKEEDEWPQFYMDVLLTIIIVMLFCVTCYCLTSKRGVISSQPKEAQRTLERKEPNIPPDNDVESHPDTTPDDNNSHESSTKSSESNTNSSVLRRTPVKASLDGQYSSTSG